MLLQARVTRTRMPVARTAATMAAMRAVMRAVMRAAMRAAMAATTVRPSEPLNRAAWRQA
jgi:hypothetical protein